jgi:hypothetical protein
MSIELKHSLIIAFFEINNLIANAKKQIPKTNRI